MICKISDLDTPSLLIDKNILKANINKMQKLCNDNGINLRPHIKTHKSPVIAKMQLKAGAIGIAAAKISEAEVFAGNGFNDIQIANIIIGPDKISKLYKLHEQVERLTCGIDSAEGAAMLSSFFHSKKKILNVFIIINSGLNRCGVDSKEELLNLAKDIQNMPGINLYGLLTHAGSVYSAFGYDERKAIGLNESELLLGYKDYLEKHNIEISEISVGSTPTAEFCSTVNGVSELRAGNYIYHDMIQVGLGSANISQCAMSLLSRVIGVHNGSRVIIDAGKKALSSDPVTRNISSVKGFGYIRDKDEYITRLSEEHGIIDEPHSEYSLNEKVRIIPNHACMVSNLFDVAYFTDGDDVTDEISIDARGKME